MSDCTATYVTGYRRGLACPHPATAIINRGSASFTAGPFLVCGHHARAYSATAVYPLSWSLATLRRWQRMNLLNLDAPPKGMP